MTQSPWVRQGVGLLVREKRMIDPVSLDLSAVDIGPVEVIGPWVVSIPGVEMKEKIRD
jgi:hypothetical protein